MKLKTLIKLLMLKEKRPDLILNIYNQDCDLNVYDYINYKDNEVLDWAYITGDALENSNDKVVIYI